MKKLDKFDYEISQYGTKVSVPKSALREAFTPPKDLELRGIDIYDFFLDECRALEKAEEEVKSVLKKIGD